MTSHAPAIPVWRVIAAFVVAPLPVAISFAFAAMGDEPLGQVHRFLATLFLGLVFFAYPAVVLLAIPAYLFLRRRVRPTWVNCALAGTAVTVLPWLVLTLLATPESEFGGGHFTVEHGNRTIWGWLDVMRSVGMVAVMGAITGLVFWIVAALGAKPIQEPAQTAHDKL